MKRLQEAIETLSIPIFATLLGLLVGSIFVWFAGVHPLETYTRLFCEGFGPTGCDSFSDLLMIDITDEDTGDVTYHFAPTYGEKGHSLALVLEQATPLILTALSATVAFKAGMFSIGMDGQFALGAVVAVFLGYWLPQQIYGLAGVANPEEAGEALQFAMRLTIPAIIIALSALVGALYSWIAGYLKVKLNVNELISTIILNAIAVQFVTFLLNGPLRADMNTVARTERIDDTAWLMPFNRAILSEVDWFNGARLGVGIIIAVIAAILLWFYIWRSTAGYEQRMTQGSRLFARFGGIPTDRAIIRAMLISGALSGIAGAIQILGVERRMVDGFVLSGTGFDGVLIAVLARESIVAIFFVAILYSGLQLGSINLQFGNIPRQLGGMIISLIILFTAMEDYFRSLIARIRLRLFGVRQIINEDDNSDSAEGVQHA
ncbi:MAG: ABC transporter permease [Anaerolineae bacterium]|nr:ABC transporter permease [Anaerolineae bacterium]